MTDAPQLSEEQLAELERELQPSLDTDLVCFHLGSLTVARFRLLLAMARRSVNQEKTDG